MVGGSFSDFMGVERYSMVKLNQGTVSTNDRDRLKNTIKVYPNPARDLVTVQLVTSDALVSAPLNGRKMESIRIVDLSGRIIASYPWQGNLGNYDVSDLAEGLYIVEIVQEERQISSNKIIVQH